MAEQVLPKAKKSVALSGIAVWHLILTVKPKLEDVQTS